MPSPRHSLSFSAPSYLTSGGASEIMDRGNSEHKQIDRGPDRFELFLLADGEKKIEHEIDTRMPNMAVFRFAKEDHTLGNLINSTLHSFGRQILFSGYQIPHPNEPYMLMRVRTDGSITPQEAIIKACRKVINDLNILSREFTKEWELKKIANTGVDGA